MNNRSTRISKVSDFLWLGEQRALDFLNTEPIIRGERVELLDSFARLTAWCVAAELVPKAAAEEVRRRWEGTRQAARTLDTAHRLRRELRLALEHRGRKRAPSLATLNTCLKAAGTWTEVAPTGGHFERRARLEVTTPDQLLRPVADAAVELLCDVEPTLVRRCDNPECVLYFHDVSKNHARRWCSMALCGNRRKVAAHQARQRRGIAPRKRR